MINKKECELGKSCGRWNGICRCATCLTRGEDIRFSGISLLRDHIKSRHLRRYGI